MDILKELEDDQRIVLQKKRDAHEALKRLYNGQTRLHNEMRLLEKEMREQAEKIDRMKLHMQYHSVEPINRILEKLNWEVKFSNFSKWDQKRLYDEIAKLKRNKDQLPQIFRMEKKLSDQRETFTKKQNELTTLNCEISVKAEEKVHLENSFRNKVDEYKQLKKALRPDTGSRRSHKRSSREYHLPESMSQSSLASMSSSSSVIHRPESLSVEFNNISPIAVDSQPSEPPPTLTGVELCTPMATGQTILPHKWSFTVANQSTMSNQVVPEPVKIFPLSAAKDTGKNVSLDKTPMTFVDNYLPVLLRRMNEDEYRLSECKTVIGQCNELLDYFDQLINNSVKAGRSRSHRNRRLTLSYEVCCLLGTLQLNIPTTFQEMQTVLVPRLHQLRCDKECTVQVLEKKVSTEGVGGPTLPPPALPFVQRLNSSGSNVTDSAFSEQSAHCVTMSRVNSSTCQLMDSSSSVTHHHSTAVCDCKVSGASSSMYGTDEEEDHHQAFTGDVDPLIKSLSALTVLENVGTSECDSPAGSSTSQMTLVGDGH